MDNKRKMQKYFRGKKIAVLGLGIENQAMLEYFLSNKIDAQITICDARSAEQLGAKFTKLNKRRNIKWKLGEDYNRELYFFDILFRSPGWPIFCPGIQEASRKNRKIALSSPMKLFFDFSPTKNIIGVTGTKGKGTTSSLIVEMLKTGKKKVYLGGNIGIAPFEFLPKLKKTDWAVLELSSFQLEDMHKSPHISVMTNFYPEHLAPADPNNPNYHKTLKSYWEAKMNIFRWQKGNDFAIVNDKLKIKNYELKSRIVKFSKSELPSRLIGEHNKENVAAAVEVAKIAGIKEGEIEKAVKKFHGLEHRLEFVGEAKGIKFYNDSFATTPEASIIGLKSFSDPIVLLVGGADKGSNFKQLAGEIKRRVKFAVLLKGTGTLRIKKELILENFPKNKMIEAANIKDAVSLARKKSVSGDVVLLSTGCASFGMFKNYKERGKLFKEEIKKQSHI